MKTLLTSLLFLIVFAITVSAQKTITVKVNKAEKILSKLQPDEYNVVIKGNLKDIAKFDDYNDPQKHWIIDSNVTINTLDLSKSYGVDSLKNIWIYKKEYCKVESLDGSFVHTIIYPKKIVLPNDIKYISYLADEFQVSPKSKIFSSKDGSLLSKDGKILILPKYKLNVIPDGVEVLSNEIFKENDSIVVPSSVKILGHNNYNPNWKLPTDSKFFCIENGVLYNKDKSEILYAKNVSNDFRIPNTIKKIGYGAFEGNSNLTEISIPDGVEIIDTSAFGWCNLKSIKLPNNLKRIEYKAFYQCELPTKINLPDNIQFIGERAFGLYKGYSQTIEDTHTNFPKNLKWIGSNFNYNTIKFDQKISFDKWYFTLDKNDWLDRKNGIPLSKIKVQDSLKLKESSFFKDLQIIDSKFLNDYIYGFVIQILNDVYEYDDEDNTYKTISVGNENIFIDKEIFDNKIKPYLSDLNTRQISIETQNLQNTQNNYEINIINPYFYKLD